MLRLLPIIAIFLVVLNKGTIVRSESPPYCGYSYNKTTSTCPGDLVEIRYPFWIENGTTDEDGDCIRYYPGFQVKCAANGRPVLNISNNLYYVLKTKEHRLMVVDVDAQECPQPRRNISFSFESMRFFDDSGLVNMTFLYNCSKYPENVVQHVPCLYNSSRGPSFAFFDSEISTRQFDWYGNCEDAVVLSKLDGSTNREYGFELIWYYPVNCGNCELTGGKCWANETTAPFHCDCPDGETRVDHICPGSYYYQSYYYGNDVKGC